MKTWRGGAVGGFNAAAGGLHSVAETKVSRAAANNATTRTNKRPSPVSVRFSDEERALLEKLAAGQPLSAYIKQCVLAKKPVARHGADPVLLTQILHAVAANDYLAGLDELAWAERNGAITLPPESQQALREACTAVTQIRRDLLHALGLNKG